MYYLDSDYILQEYCYSEGKGWFAGAIGEIKAKTCPNSRIGAIVYGSGSIRVYYQSEYHLSTSTPFIYRNTLKTSSASSEKYAAMVTGLLASCV